jgi:hypothetical protein
MKRVINGHVSYGWKECACGQIISGSSQRCLSCEARRRHREGILVAPPQHDPETLRAWAVQRPREADGRYRSTR